jgi:hypothetical protein
MKILVAAAVTALFLLIPFGANAGGSFEDSPEQMAIPQTKVVVVQPDNGGDNSNVVGLAIVAAIGAAGVVGAAYVSRRRG